MLTSTDKTCSVLIRTRKKAAYQNRKLLDNKYCTPPKQGKGGEICNAAPASNEQVENLDFHSHKTVTRHPNTLIREDSEKTK